METLSNSLQTFWNIIPKLNCETNGIGTKYYSLTINKKDDVHKIISANLLNDTELKKVSSYYGKLTKTK